MQLNATNSTLPQRRIAASPQAQSAPRIDTVTVHDTVLVRDQAIKAKPQLQAVEKKKLSVTTFGVAGAGIGFAAGTLAAMAMNAATLGVVAFIAVAGAALLGGGMAMYAEMSNARR